MIFDWHLKDNQIKYGVIVKWLSQQTFNLPIPGSSPGGPTILKHIRSSSENIQKEQVIAGDNRLK